MQLPPWGYLARVRMGTRLLVTPNGVLVTPKKVLVTPKGVLVIDC